MSVQQKSCCLLDFKYWRQRSDANMFGSFFCFFFSTSLIGTYSLSLSTFAACTHSAERTPPTINIIHMLCVVPRSHTVFLFRSPFFKRNYCKSFMVFSLWWGIKRSLRFSFSYFADLFNCFDSFTHSFILIIILRFQKQAFEKHFPFYYSNSTYRTIANIAHVASASQ